MLNTTYLASLDDWPGKAYVIQGAECSHALCAATYFGHEAIVEVLLKDGAAVNMQIECGYALVYASEKGYEKIVRMLLDLGVDVNARGGEHRSALQQAMYIVLRGARYGGHRGVVRLLQGKLSLGNSVGLNQENERQGSLLDGEASTSSIKQEQPLPSLPNIIGSKSFAPTTELF